MKMNKILVTTGAGLTLSSGAKAIAVLPACKGQDKSFMLLENGNMATMRGQRLAGVGAARYFTERGFAPAQPGNPPAEKLADMVDCYEGTTLVEKHNQAMAETLARAFGGQKCTYVPFDEDKPIVSVTVEPYRGIISTAFDLGSGFAAGCLSVVYDRNSTGGMLDVKLNSGWLVGPENSAADMPRNTEYGGPVERAVFIICNSGIGRLLGAKNLGMDDDAPVDAQFPRGQLVIGLKNDDRIVVGINAVDELVVQYIRDDAVLYSRSGFQGNGLNALREGEVVGAIAAVLVRVQEMDATPVKSSRAKLKKAA